MPVLYTQVTLTENVKETLRSQNKNYYKIKTKTIDKMIKKCMLQ